MAEGGGDHHEHTRYQEPTLWRGTADKQKEPAIPEWRAMPKREEYPSEPTAPWTGAEDNSSSLGNINPLTISLFTSPGKPSYTPSHPTDMCTVSPVTVAPSAPPNMAPPAYHRYQMHMVHNSYTKAVENRDMLPPHFNGQLENYYEWVDELQQLIRALRRRDVRIASGWRQVSVRMASGWRQDGVRMASE